MKKKKKLRPFIYDTIIYICLFGAITFLLIGTNSYLKNYENESIRDVAKQIFFNSSNSQNQATIITPIESINIKKSDKEKLILSYLESINDRITNDDLITYDMIKTWTKYDIKNLNFVKNITEEYYEYTFDLYINKDGILPTSINEKLSTEETNVITLKVFILETDNGYIIKNIDPS